MKDELTRIRANLYRVIRHLVRHQYLSALTAAIEARDTLDAYMGQERETNDAHND